MYVFVAMWLFFFGVWPLAHPQHDTWLDVMTWLDWMLHLGGLTALILIVR